MSRAQAQSSLWSGRRRAVAMLGAAAGLALLAGCHEDMWIQPKARQLQQSDVFSDGSEMRPLPPHTVDQTHFWSDAPRYTGVSAGKYVTELPFKMTRNDLERGQERFNIYCSPCHGALGDGMGMIAMRGFSERRKPASYHTDRLRTMPIGHFYDVITNGYGVMYSYASRVEPDDRWRIAAYIRVLQRSQHAQPTDLPDNLDPQLKQSLLSAPAPNTAPETGTPPPAGTPTSQTPPAAGSETNSHGQ